MEVQIKKTTKAGNSSAVVLPKSWLNKEVRVELVKKSKKTILLESLEILDKIIDLKEIIGIYLVGSYARGEENSKSDIDILVITNKTDKEMVQEGQYSLLIVSKELVSQKLREDLLPIGQMIKESVPLINSGYLGSVKLKVTKKNVGWYIRTTKEKVSLIEKVLNKLDDRKVSKVDNSVVYTLVLRVRTLEIIKKLLKDENYSKKEFIELVKKISGNNLAYESYIKIKNNHYDKPLSSVEESKRLLDYLKKSLEEVEEI